MGLNGSKLYVTSGKVARSILVLCRTDQDRGHRGLVAHHCPPRRARSGARQTRKQDGSAHLTDDPGIF